ncbi:hypothetical protein ACQ4PT_039357 [Festuca glaucescens]
MQKEILHGTHKEHPLVFRATGRSFSCDGCKCGGVGSCYRCNFCDFDLHEYCAMSPPTATFAFHGQHPLTLERAAVVENLFTFERALLRGENLCKCDLCNTPIKGMHYSCRPCDFDVHPVCSRLPAAAVSPLHPEHLVMLTLAKPMACMRCDTLCEWRYRCAPCKVNLHPRCLLGSDKTPLNIPKENCHRSSGLFWS